MEVKKHTTKSISDGFATISRLCGKKNARTRLLLLQSKKNQLCSSFFPPLKQMWTEKYKFPFFI